MSEALILEKLDAILAALTLPETPSAGIQPPDVPELTLTQINPATIDGVTIQRDGSTWTLDQGKPVGLIYGYITKAKDPAQWAMMVAAVGGDESRLVALLEANGGPFTRYKLKPIDFLKDATGGEPLHRLNYALSNPLPPAAPTV